jgi:UDP-2,4-diacetamido-2,4,6-trideoxy-beta-L-altropyranose hydrolase
MRRVVFRVDKNKTIGFGHFYRCYAIAEILNEDFKLVFVTLDMDEMAKNMLNAINADYSVVKNDSDFISYLNSDDIVVLDGYNFTSQLQCDIKSRGAKLVVIDDLCEGHFVADCILNSDPFVQADRYSKESYSKLYLGLDYMIIRKSFLENRDNMDKKNSNTWLMSFGGILNLELYLKFIDYLNKSKEITQIEVLNVVVNFSVNHKKLFEDYINTHLLDFKVVIHQNLNAKEMISLMDTSLFGIFPGSGLLREGLVRNVLCITGYLEDNQKPIANFFSDKEIAYNIGHFAFTEYSDFINAANELKMRRNNVKGQLLKLIDGKQIDRLNSIFMDI